MTDLVDDILRRLADEPVPARLACLESDVMRRIEGPGSASAIAPSWRVAAIGLGRVVGLGVGGSAAVALKHPPSGLAESIAGTNLAPSALLAAS